jgi:hypothetical protein
MRDDDRKRVVSYSVGVAARLVRLYPARTRAQFGDDLVATTAELIADAETRGGASAVLRLWPRLLADFGTALASEYRDVWCASRFDPERSAYLSLAIASAVWILIFAASAFNSRWAAMLLDASLLLTMVLAFGLPVAAYLMSRLARINRNPRSSTVTPQRLSAAATVSSWAALACHIA